MALLDGRLNAQPLLDSHGDDARHQSAGLSHDLVVTAEEDDGNI